MWAKIRYTMTAIAAASEITTMTSQPTNPTTDRALPVIRPDSVVYSAHGAEMRPAFHEGQRVWVRGLFPNKLVRGHICGFAGRAADHDVWIVDFGAILGQEGAQMYAWSCAVVAHTYILTTPSARVADQNWGFRPAVETAK